MNSRRTRRGATLVLVLFIISILVTMAVFSIDVAYMQLVRTELRAATDAAAKAGAEMLSRTGDGALATQAAIDMAQQNQVAGAGLVLHPDEIVLGRSNRNPTGSWEFLPGATPFTSLRVDTRLAGDRAPRLLLGRLLGRNTFTPQKAATAAYAEHEVCLVVDRSHSMTFDLTGVDFAYPPGTPALPLSLTYPPHSSLSRWAYLRQGVEQYVSTIQSLRTTQRVALVTWASEIGPTSYEAVITGQTSPASTIDVPLGQNFVGISNAVAARNSNVMLGATNMSGGIDMGVSVLTGAGSRPYANKTMIVMTDGLWNQGRNPVEAALDAKAHGITVYVITFLDSVNQGEMQSVAEATGGRHFHADNGPELVQVFRELALTLPVVITD